MSIRPNPAGQNKKIKWGHLQNFKTYVNNASKEEEQLTPEEKRQQLFAAMKPYNSEDYIGKAIFAVGGGGVYDTTPSVSPSPTPTPSITPTSSLTPTPTITPTITPTSTNTPTPSITPTNTTTPTITPTSTNTPTPSITPTNTTTPTNTPTPSITPTNTTTPTNTPTSTNTPTPTPSSSPLPSGTTEANAYLTRVVSAGGTIDSTISAATRTLFTSLVSNNLYDKLYAFYPHIGGVSASHALNAKSTGNTITFNGGWAFSNAAGSDPNGTNAYGQLGGVSSSVYAPQDSSSMGFYSLTNNFTTDRKDMGSYTSSNGVENLFMVWASAIQSPYIKVNAATPTIGANLVSDTTGMFIASRSEATKQFMYRNGSFLLSGTSTSTGTNNIDLFIANQNEDGVPSIQYSTRAHGFTFAGQGFSPSEVSTLSTIINNFQTSLSRNTY